MKCGALDAHAGQPRAEARRARRGAIEVATRAARDRDVRPVHRSSASVDVVHHEDLKPQLRVAARVADPRGSSAWEKETLGIFVSGHPLADVADALARRGASQADQGPAHASRTTAFVTVAGMLTAVRRTMTKAQQQMLIATLEDMTGSVECVVFPKSVRAAPSRRSSPDGDRDAASGRVRFRERRGSAPGEDAAPLEVSVTVSDAKPSTSAANVPAAPQGWHVESDGPCEEIDALARLLAESPGPRARRRCTSGDASRARDLAASPTGVYVKLRARGDLRPRRACGRRRSVAERPPAVQMRPFSGFR